LDVNVVFKQRSKVSRANNSPSRALVIVTGMMVT